MPLPKMNTGPVAIAYALRQGADALQLSGQIDQASASRFLADTVDGDTEQIRREERAQYDADRQHMALRIRQAESAARVLLEKLAELTALQAPAPILVVTADCPNCGDAGATEWVNGAAFCEGCKAPLAVEPAP